MATQWVLGKISDALAPTVSNGVATAGSFAGGAISAVGSSINGVGEGINNSIRRYGDGVKDYGNGVMDWTKATGSRAQTASNPLGLTSGAAQGKTLVTSPRVYQAQPRSNASKTLTTTNKGAQKKIEAGTPKKALPAPGPKSGVTRSAGTGPLAKSDTKAPVKKAGVSTTSSAPNPGAMRKSTTKPGGATKKIAPVKPSTASAPKTSIAKPKSQVNHTAAANPLGLSF